MNKYSQLESVEIPGWYKLQSSLFVSSLISISLLVSAVLHAICPLISPLLDSICQYIYLLDTAPAPHSHCHCFVLFFKR